MPITLDATVGGISSNSYLTVARAADLANRLPHMQEWFTNYLANKPQLLMHATTLIDRYGHYYGAKANHLQALAFPRAGLSYMPEGMPVASGVIPDFIEWATIEWAFYLMNNAEASGDAVGLGIDYVKTPSYWIQFSNAALSGPQVPTVVADLLRPYARRIGLNFAKVLRT